MDGTNITIDAHAGCAEAGEVHYWRDRGPAQPGRGTGRFWTDAEIAEALQRQFDAGYAAGLRAAPAPNGAPELLRGAA